MLRIPEVDFALIAAAMACELEIALPEGHSPRSCALTDVV